VESEFGGHLLKTVERVAAEIGNLKVEVENLQRRQEAFEFTTQRVIEELLRGQAELRQRQETQDREWQDFGARWSACSATWEARMQYLEDFTRQLEVSARQLQAFAVQLTALLPSEE